MFLNVIEDAAKDARRTLRQVEWRTQAADHPILLNVPSTQYLKFLIVHVI
jgi:23S rRNA (cytosine1962-C5)-methyltransferase